MESFYSVLVARMYVMDAKVKMREKDGEKRKSKREIKCDLLNLQVDLGPLAGDGDVDADAFGDADAYGDNI